MLLSSMGNPGDYPVYWDKMLINASQVTNPSIDPLQEHLETRVFLGKKPSHLVIVNRVVKEWLSAWLGWWLYSASMGVDYYQN